MAEPSTTPARARLPHAGRVGAARRDLARLAAQRRATGPASSRAIPWVFAEIVRQPRAQRARPPDRRTTREHEARGARGARQRRRRLDARRLRPRGPPIAPGRATSCPLRRAGTGRDAAARRRGQLALQRLGEVPELEARRRARRAASRRRLGVRALRPTVRAAAACRARGRRHRRRRRGHAARHRGVPARRDVQARNPELGREGTEQTLRDYLGVDARCSGSATASPATTPHGHVDDFARFVAPGRVVLAAENEPGDPNYRALAETRERLQGARDAHGPPLEVVTLPMPAPLVFDGSACRRATRTSTSPTTPCSCRPSTTRTTASRSASSPSCFPGREVVGIHAVDLVWASARSTASTQQEPAV